MKSSLAKVGDPKTNKNYRCNPSILIRYRAQNETSQAQISGTNNPKNILIDAGKTFRESAVRWFPVHNVRSIDSVLLTHGHADSIFGIDDLRSTQQPMSRRPLDVYQSVETRAVTQQAFRYLYPELNPDNYLTPEELLTIKERTLAIAEATPGAVPQPTKRRFTANINWIDIFPYRSFPVCGLDILPLPVMHGEDLQCMAFMFGTTHKVCYISDISRMLPRTLDTILHEKEASRGELELLVIDSIRLGRTDYIRTPYPTHIAVEEALDLIRIIKPKRALLIGMGSTIEHHGTNKYLKGLRVKEPELDVELAFDGMKVENLLL